MGSGKVKRICSRYTPNENLKHKETVDYIIQYIHEHYAENIHLQDVADQVYISKTISAPYSASLQVKPLAII